MTFYLKRRKRVLKKFFVAVSLFSLGIIVLYLFFAFSRHIPFLKNADQPAMLVFIMTLVSVLAYKPLDYVFTQLFKNYLFQKKSYRHITLMNLAEELTLILDLQELANLVVNTFGEVLHLKTVALVVPSRIRGDYEIASAFGWKVSDVRHIRLADESPLITLVRANGPHIIVRDRAVRTLSWQEANLLSHDFDSLRATWLIPLFVQDELTGIIAFASQRPEAVFDESDFQFFREFAHKVAKCARNALSVLDLKMANEELQDVQSQLLQNTKLAAIEQLATGLAHEIHNPLTIISGKAQVLLLQKDRKAIDERVEEVLKTIVKQTKRAADITRKLLMFSQGSGAPKEPLSLEQVLNDTIALVSYQTSLEGIEITRGIGSSIPLFYANVHELREVFLNLILNAVQSVGTQGKIHIDLQYLAADQLIEIRISDTGPGILPEHIDKLFNPFFTTRHESVGLGLFVTKQIVHRYGGAIRAESHTGKGTLFLIQLPYMEPSGDVPSQKDITFSFTRP
ncbi:MAG: GAF domain-containing protein [Candidatus Omnitrophica bacterium]|nr:GAF domain-containing protein [Candidatus Omnitrophota bacterium]